MISAPKAITTFCFVMISETKWGFGCGDRKGEKVGNQGCGTSFLGLGVFFVVIVWWGAVISLGRNLYFLIERLNCDGILIDVVILKVW